ncbi:hypothetical protein [Bradyrhizobium sp. USDA 4452]
MKITKVVLATAFIFGSIAAAFAQGGGGGGGGGGNSPSQKSGQGASSSPSSANPGATANDTAEKGGMKSGTGMKSSSHKRHKKSM